MLAEPTTYDPFGDGSERDSDLPNLIDGDTSTSWRTERYFAPLDVIGKDGVGIAFDVLGTPRRIEFSASIGTRFVIRWAEAVPDAPDAWEDVASGTALGGPIVLQLPAREDGIWLIWLVDLPEQAEDEFFTEIGEVTFRP